MSGDYSIVPQQVSEPESSDLLTDVIVGLSSNPRTLPCKYFYDERGAALFQKICELPEYYITRTEIDILDRNRAEIASQLGPERRTDRTRHRRRHQNADSDRSTREACRLHPG